MKGKNKLISIIAIIFIAVIGISFTACDDILDEIVRLDALAGTWHTKGSLETIDDAFWSDGRGIFTEGMYSSYNDTYIWFLRGTYSISGNNLTKTYTHLYGTMIGMLALGEMNDLAAFNDAFEDVNIDSDVFYSESQIRALGSHEIFTFVADYLGFANTASMPQSFVFNNSNQFTLTDNLSTPTSTVYTKAGAVLSIVGAWLGVSDPWTNTYTFNSDGTGTIRSVAHITINQDFTWVLNGNLLTLSFTSVYEEVYIITLNGSASITMSRIKPSAQAAFTLTKQQTP
ncbi:MAG: hypothetical protein FWD36_06310 [Treponema sp.]|nr:hypothetical protein [Treponema sp.]